MLSSFKDTDVLVVDKQIQDGVYFHDIRMVDFN